LWLERVFDRLRLTIDLLIGFCGKEGSSTLPFPSLPFPSLPFDKLRVNSAKGRLS